MSKYKVLGILTIAAMSLTASIATQEGVPLVQECAGGFLVDNYHYESLPRPRLVRNDLIYGEGGGRIPAIDIATLHAEFYIQWGKVFLVDLDHPAKIDQWVGASRLTNSAKVGFLISENQNKVVGNEIRMEYKRVRLGEEYCLNSQNEVFSRPSRGER